MIAAGLWERIPPSRRAFAAAVAALVAIALLVALTIEGQRNRARLEEQLPRLRASIAALERDAAEVKRLRSMPTTSAASPGQPAAPLAALATNGVGLPGAQVSVLDERRVKVSGNDVGFGQLLEFLQNARATHGMRVESARLEALPAAGRVRAELLLARS